MPARSGSAWLAVSEEEEEEEKRREAIKSLKTNCGPAAAKTTSN